MLTIDPELCPSNHACPLIRICPVKAISQENNHSTPLLNTDLCVECLKCIRKCPYEAVVEIKS